MKKTYVVLLVILVFGLIAANLALRPDKATPPPASTAQETVAPNFGSDYSVLDTMEMRTKLVDFMGPQAFATMRANLQVVMPITANGDWKVYYGVKSGGTEEASLWLNQKDESAIAFVIHENLVTVYLAEGMGREQLPAGFIDMLVEENYNHYPVSYVGADGSIL